MATCCFCKESVSYFDGKTCKFCNETCCFKHLQPENHNCIKTRYTKYIKKEWLRKYGQDISHGSYLIKCETCGFTSKFAQLIELAGNALEQHLKENPTCKENKIFLEELQ